MIIVMTRGGEYILPHSSYILNFKNERPYSTFHSPPAALSQGMARTAVDHEIDVEVLPPVTTRGPQTGNRADGSRPCSRCHCLFQSPPAALQQGIAQTAVDHEVDVEVLALVTTRGPQSRNRADGSRPCSRFGCPCSCHHPRPYYRELRGQQSTM
jgi:hypothetical protein